MLKRNSLSLLLGCLFCLNGHHGAYGFYPYGGYGASGAYQQQQQAAENEAKSSAQSSSAVQQNGLDHGGFGQAPGYPLGFRYYGPVAAAGVYNQQQQSAENEAYSRAASQSSAGAGYYVPAAIAYPLPNSAPYSMSAAQAVAVGGSIQGGGVTNAAKGDGDASQTVAVAGDIEGGVISNTAGGAGGGLADKSTPRPREERTEKPKVEDGVISNTAGGGGDGVSVEAKSPRRTRKERTKKPKVVRRPKSTKKPKKGKGDYCKACRGRCKYP